MSFQSALAFVDTTYQHIQTPTNIYSYTTTCDHDSPWQLRKSIFKKRVLKTLFFQPQDQELNPAGNSEYVWCSEKLLSDKNTDKIR